MIIDKLKKKEENWKFIHSNEKRVDLKVLNCEWSVSREIIQIVTQKKSW